MSSNFLFRRNLIALTPLKIVVYFYFLIYNSGIKIKRCKNYEI